MNYPDSTLSAEQRGNFPLPVFQTAFAPQLPPEASPPIVFEADPAQASQGLLGRCPEQLAMNALAVIVDRLGQSNPATDIDLAEAIKLLKMLKWAHGEGHLQCLPRDSALMAALAGQLRLFLSRLGQAVAQGRLLLGRLELEDIHDICNGLSACFGADQASCLFSAGQRDGMAVALRALNQALIAQALKEGLPKDIRSNGMLIDILNWQSRGLKQKLFSATDKQIQRLFKASLAMMHQWIAPDGKGMPSTQVDVMDTRQLGKCMVQLNTIFKYGLLDLDATTQEGSANRKLLGEVALGLCGGLAAGFRSWRRVGDDNSSSGRRELETVAVEGVTNIANTVKDFLAAGLIAPSAAALPAIIGQLSAWMEAIPPAQLYGRGGQGLGNCCNFLRGMAEHLLAGATLPAEQRARLRQACRRMLRLAEDFANASALESDVQPLVNLVSFVKVMHKMGGHDHCGLVRLAGRLLAALDRIVDRIEHAESISGLLAGLVYFSANGLVMSGQAVKLLESLVAKGQALVGPRWSAEGRRHLVEGALLGLDMSTDKAVHKTCTTLLNALLGLYRPGEERLPYLKAARFLIGDDAQRLQDLQAMLRLLLGRQGDVSMAELEAEIASLRNASGEPAFVAPPALPAQQETVQAQAQADTTTTSWRAGPTYRAPATTTVPTTRTSTGATGTLTSSPDWQQPKKVASRPAAQRVAAAEAPARRADAGKGAQARARQASSSAIKPARAASALKSSEKRPRPSPEEEWFALLAQTGPETAQSLERLKVLAEKTPSLLEASTGKGAARRSALHLALARGKPRTVAWLSLKIGVVDVDDAVTPIRKLFDDPEVLIDVCHKKALQAYIDSLPQEAQKHVCDYFRMWHELVPRGFQEVLIERGLLAGGAVAKAPAAPEKASRAKKAPDPLREMNVILVKEGTNNLMLCVRSRRLEAVQVLLDTDDGKAQALAQDANGKNALMYAFRRNLADQSAPSGAPSSRAQSETQLAPDIHLKPFEALRASNPIAAKLLVLPSANEQAKAVSSQGSNALMDAIQHGSVEGALALLKLPSANEQALARDADGRNALIHAAYLGDVFVMTLLLELPNLAQQWVPDNQGMNFEAHLLKSRNPEVIEHMMVVLDEVMPDELRPARKQ